MQLASPILIRPSDANNVVGILLDQVLVLIYKGDAHPLRCILRRTENNGLLHPPVFLQILRDPVSHLIDPVCKNNAVIKIPVIINTVLYLIPVIILLPFVRPPAITDVHRHAEHPERSKETVLDPRLQTVLIDRFSEIVYVRHIHGLFRCRCHTDLSSALEVFKDPSPTAVRLSGPPVALIDDDEIKEIRIKELAVVLLIIIPDQLLIQGKIDLIGRDRVSIVLCKIYLMDDLLKRRKVLLYRLVHEVIAVR